MTDANGDTTTFGYDQNGNQVRQTLPPVVIDGQTVTPTETWIYNAYNQIATFTDFDGNTATYTYLPAGNPHAGARNRDGSAKPGRERI